MRKKDPARIAAGSPAWNGSAAMEERRRGVAPALYRRLSDAIAILRRHQASVTAS
jgi:hypothetical protein